MKNIDIENVESINVGMVGHIDHGKTTLLYRLTGKFADTHSEELKRGITIKLGYADTIIEKNGKKRYVSFIDCPGHKMLMATMLSGAALMDAAILVIAANEGIRAQTREHLIALEAKKVKQILIVQNKIDLVNKEEAMKNYREIKEFVKGTIAEDSPIIPISAQQNINIDKVRDFLMKVEIPKRDLNSDPLFLIARSFDINKPGTEISKLKGGVIAGILKRGKLKIGDEIEIKPGISEKQANQIFYKPIRTRIVSIYKGNFPIKKAVPGSSIAFETELDNILTKSDSLSGCVVSLPNVLPNIADKIKIKYELFKTLVGAEEKNEKDMKIEDLKTEELIMLSINTTTTVGEIKKLKDKEAEIHLRIPVVPIKGESVGIARNIKGQWRLIGHGEIL